MTGINTKFGQLLCFPIFIVTSSFSFVMSECGLWLCFGICHMFLSRIDLLASFTKLRKATVSFLMFCRLEQICCDWADFHEIWYLSIFRKYVSKIQVSLNSDKNNEYFTWRPTYIFIISGSFLRGMETFSDEFCTENQTHILCSINIFRKSCRLWDNVKNLIQLDRRRWHCNKAHAHWMLYT